MCTSEPLTPELSIESVHLFAHSSGFMHHSPDFDLSVLNRDSTQTFEELSDIFSDHNNYLTSRELLMRVSPNWAVVSC